MMVTEGIVRDDWRCPRLGRVVQNVNNARKFEKFTDVTFIVGPDGDSCVIKAHRVVIGTANAELKQLMLVSDDVARIPDVSPRGFKNLIKFLYDTDVKFSDLSGVRETYRVAEKFKVDELKLVAESYLNEVVKFETILEILEMAVAFKLPKLLTKCLDIILNRYKEVLKLDELVSSPYEVVEAVLNARPCRGESCQYQALLVIPKWQTKHNVDRIRLQNLLNCVSFKRLKMTDFNDFIQGNKGLLSDVDIEAFQKYILSKENCDAPKWYRDPEQVPIENDYDDAEKADKCVIENFSQTMELQKLNVQKALDEELHYIEKILTEAADVSIETHKVSLNKTVRSIVNIFSDIINEVVETAIENIENDIKDQFEEDANSKMNGKESDSCTKMDSVSTIKRLSKSEKCGTNENEITQKYANLQIVE